MRKTLTAVAALVLAASAAPAHAAVTEGAADIDHIVVIFEENHSFDNLYGTWEGVRGLSQATLGKTVQVDQLGLPLGCLPQNDVNLATPPQPVRCIGLAGLNLVSSAFGNTPFAIDDYIQPDDRTCPLVGEYTDHGTVKDSPGSQPGGCTADMIHRFYTQQWQINGGAMNRFTAGSDAVGLTQGYYKSQNLPLYKYLHAAGAPRYAIADNFFHAAFGGSFLNHQWLIAARTPTYPNAVRDGSDNDLHSVVGADGNPADTPLHPAPAVRRDRSLSQAANPDGSCYVPPNTTAPPAGTVCGDFAVNTMQPAYQPIDPFYPANRQLPAQTAPTIGDRLSAKGISWAWYSGGWNDANGDIGGPGWTNGNTPGTCTNADTVAGATYPYCMNGFFQTHHQPFNYYKNYAPGTPARAQHLKDEVEFITAAKTGTLRKVSFIKPNGAENEHPGYASQASGSSHLVDLLKTIFSGPKASKTMVIVTYDENGGSWDHVSPPKTDRWGPGTRVPTMVLSPQLAAPFGVDHTVYDTTSVLATIEQKYGLAPLASRDAAVKNMWGIFNLS